MRAKKIFILVVEDFFVQYFSTEDADYFCKALRAIYLITVDMVATVYIGNEVEWDYVDRNVILSMRSYMHKALHRFQHILRGGKEYSHHTCSPIHYGQKVQYADPLDAAKYLSDK